MLFDLAIIGGGPAGAAAAVYASRKKLHSILLTDSFGGQSTESLDVQNWVGTVSISGTDLAKQLRAHVEAYRGDILTIEERTRVARVTKKGDSFVLTTEKGAEFEARAILVATGASRRKLQVPGATEFENKGITYCASCDAPLFGDADVVVIGGGNAGFETAAQLLAHAKSVTLLQHSGAFKADPITVEKVLAHPHMKALVNAELKEVRGSSFVEEVVYVDTTTNEEHTIKATGVFVEIGLMPATEMVQDLVERDQYGRIVIDPWTQRSSLAGIWAAGDCSNVHFHQNNIAAGDAVKALEDIYLFLKAH